MPFLLYGGSHCNMQVWEHENTSPSCVNTTTKQWSTIDETKRLPSKQPSLNTNLITKRNHCPRNFLQLPLLLLQLITILKIDKQRWVLLVSFIDEIVWTCNYVPSISSHSVLFCIALPHRDWRKEEARREGSQEGSGRTSSRIYFGRCNETSRGTIISSFETSQTKGKAICSSWIHCRRRKTSPPAASCLNISGEDTGVDVFICTGQQGQEKWGTTS